MIPTFLISVREYLEAFLIIGVFLGISRKLALHRGKEILAASATGMVISLALPIVVFLMGARASQVFTERNADLLEGYLMIFSGVFVAYVVFSLHKMFTLRRSKTIIEAHQKLQSNVFDISLFLTIAFFIIREGVEIALFTATTSLFSKFADNFIGLLLGFTVSSVLGFLTFFAYIKVSIGKVFRATEYLIVVMGASFVANGISELTDVYLGRHLEQILPVKLMFLPDSSSLIGGLIKTTTGMSQEYSIPMFAVTVTYIAILYALFLRKRSPTTSWQ